MVRLPVLGADDVLGHVPNKGLCALGDGDVALEHGLKVLGLAEVDLRVFLVLGDGGSVEVDAGEEALGAGVAEQFGVHLPVGGGLGAAPDGAGSGRGVAADLELVLEQILQAAVIDGDQDQVRGLSADLQAPGSAGHADKDRGAPALACTAGDHALAILRAEDEGTLDHPGDDGDAGGLLKDVHGDAAVLGGHDLVEDNFGGVDACLEVVAGGAGEGRGGQQEANKQNGNLLFHLEVLSLRAPGDAAQAE